MITKAFKFGEFKHKVTPMEHQEKNFLATRDLEYFGNFWEMGCAKTKVMIDTAAWLFLKGEIDGVLVITDKGVYRNWADYEIPIHMMEGIPARVRVWQSTCGKKAQHEVNQLLIAREDCLDILIMNVEAFAHDKAPTFAQAFLDSHYGMTIIDESDSIAHATAKRTKAILDLRDLSPYRRILTGTPIADSPLAVYTQAEFLKPGLLGYNSFVAFRAEYAHLMLMDLGPGKKFYKITGYKNVDKLQKSMQSWSSRLLKTDCLDLPDKVYEVFHIEHTPEQARIYNQLKEEALTQLEAGTISSTSAMTTLTKLHQINCGHVKIDKLDTEEEGQTVDIPSNRVAGLLALLHKVKGKVIIWACFRRDFDLIGEALTKEFGIESWVNYYGGTEQNQRPENVKRFKTEDSCRFFLSNPTTGGRGITLVEASYAIRYSYGWRLSPILQSEDRNYRKGQINSCTYVDLCTPGTIDVKIRASHRAKRELSSSILDNLREVLQAD